MKTIYSSSAKLTLLLGSALFFTSCTKEELQVPQSGNGLENNQGQGTTAQSATSNARITCPTYILKPNQISSPYTFQVSQLTVCSIVISYEEGPKTIPLKVELYQNPNPSDPRNMMSLMWTVGGHDGVWGNTFWTASGASYWVLLKYQNAYYQLPIINIGEGYRVNLIGTSINLLVSLSDS